LAPFDLAPANPAPARTKAKATNSQRQKPPTRARRITALSIIELTLDPRNWMKRNATAKTKKKGIS
jgi:hypothetical protein